MLNKQGCYTTVMNLQPLESFLMIFICHCGAPGGVAIQWIINCLQFDSCVLKLQVIVVYYLRYENLNFRCQ